MACTRETKTCPVTHDYTPLNECCKQIIIDNLTTLTGLLERENIKYWLDYGTLLGATRDGKFIPWDRDADIGILEEDIDKLEGLYSELRKLGYNPVIRKRYNGQPSCHIKIDASVSNDRHVCIFIWYNDNGILRRTNYIGMRSHLGTDTKKGGDFPYSWIENLSKIKFEQNEYYAPLNPEVLCQHRYGVKWKTPLNVADWNHVNEHNNNTSKYNSTKLSDRLEVAPLIGITREISNSDEHFRITNKQIILEYAIIQSSKLCIGGEYVELGTYKGESTNIIANVIPMNNILNTFDSFDGGVKPGLKILNNRYKLNESDIPKFGDNVVIHRGLFSDKLKKWVDNNNDKFITFANIDCDDYSTTKEILNILKPMLSKPAIVVFNKFYNYKGSVLNQYRAFQEFRVRSKLPYKVLAKTYDTQAVIYIL